MTRDRGASALEYALLAASICAICLGIGMTAKTLLKSDTDILCHFVNCGDGAYLGPPVGGGPPQTEPPPPHATPSCTPEPTPSSPDVTATPSACPSP